MSVAGSKFGEIEYKENRKEISLLSEYAVEVLSFLNLRWISEDLGNEVNFLGFDESLFEKFKSSKECEGLKMVVMEKRGEREKRIMKIREEIKGLSINECKLRE